MKRLLQFSLIILSITFLTGCGFFEWASGACEWFEDSHTESHCYQKIGIYTNSPEICEDAEYGGTRTKCYILLAQRQGDGSYCESIGDNEMGPQYAKEQCYQAVAIETGDSSYCDKMGSYKSYGNEFSGGSGFSKEECLSLAGTGANEEDEEDIDEDEDEDEEDTEEGECKYDSDCDSICEGNTYWKMGCNARTNMCEKTFDTNCLDEETLIGEFTFPKLCDLSAQCIDDTSTIKAIKSTLTGDANSFQTLMQNVETARKQSLNNCLSALSDVTNKFIIDSAITFSGLAGLRVNTSYQSMANFSKYVQPSGSTVASLATAQVTGPVQGLLDKLGSIAIADVTGDAPKMPVEQYIDLHCNASKTLATEHARLAVERDKLIGLAKPFHGW